MFFVLDENNNKIEAYDKEGFLAFLESAITNHTLEGIASDSAFVDKLKCCVTGGTNKVAFVTQAQYNELAAAGTLIANCLYYITDDTTCEDIDSQLEIINDLIDGLSNGCSYKSEARQYISETELSTISRVLYEAGTAAEVDISDLMLSGKTAADTIGISGVLSVAGSTIITLRFEFSTLWSFGIGDVAHNKAAIMCTARNNDPYVLGITLSINATNKLQLETTPFYCFNLKTGVDWEVSTISLESLNIFYK